jgi:uncharacterized protein (TIGR03435 family)
MMVATGDCDEVVLFRHRQPVSCSLHGQTPSIDRNIPTFEVASIKPNITGDARSGYNTGQRGFVGTNVTARSLIRYAYHVQDFQLVDTPDWVRNERYDVIAKSDHEPQDDEMRLMMRALLAERFQLTAHHDKRELSIYALVMLRADHRLGPNITKSEKDCTADCGTSVNESRQAATLIGRGISMDALAVRLSDSANRVVVDRTGLSANYDVNLSWTPEQSATTTGASLFTALQEQLGLKLESTRGPVEVLVIDHIERPTPD